MSTAHSPAYTQMQTDLLAAASDNPDTLATVLEAIRRLDEPHVPTVQEYFDVVLAASAEGTRKTYLTYWKHLTVKLGDVPINQVTASALQTVALEAKTNARKRRNSRGGRSAQENCVGALRAFFARAVMDNLIDKNPAMDVKKPRRLPSPRRALTAKEFQALDNVTRSGGNDPLLDTLLLRFHAETGARRGGAIALRLKDLDAHNLTVRLHEKGETSRWQPVSPTLFQALLHHSQARGATERDDQVFRYLPKRGSSLGAPLTRRRYNTLTNRWHAKLPWAATYGVSPHWLRHTTLTSIERISGSTGVVRKFAGHSVPNDPTLGYLTASDRDVAVALSILTGEPHPLAEPE